MFVRTVVSLGLGFCWLASLMQPVAETVDQNGSTTWSGVEILMMGWMGPLMGHFGWFANLLLPPVLLMTALVKEDAPKTRVGLGIALGLLAANSLYWSSIPMDNGSNPIASYQSGYWLWLVSMFGAACWSVTTAFLPRGEGSIPRGRAES